ncbi:MAG: DUF488 domain-containing protein [Nocardioides sp.]
MRQLRTVGHGTLAEADFAELLQRAGVQDVVDIRSFPGSRRNPQFGRDEMARWLPQAGLGYSWAPALGGRRRSSAESEHVALRHDAFRAYADHIESEEFRAGVRDQQAMGEQVAVMCSESVWWRCHRRLVADHLTLLHGVEVLHVMHDGRCPPHQPTDGVRVVGDRLLYDVLPDQV